MLLFEDAAGRISHRRHVIDFVPFRHDDLADAIRAAGFTIRGDSYQPEATFYAIAAGLT